MNPSAPHPYTGKSNGRYMTVTFELNDNIDLDRTSLAAAWRDVINNLRIYQSPAFAPHCCVTGLSAGDAMSELESMEEECRNGH